MLDGLRALAVALVLLHHSGALPGGAGGSVGVTSFFVLSGYLITALLVDEHRRTGSVNLRSFYLRRTRRLLPPLLVVVASSSIFLAIVGRPDMAASGAAGALSYAANWLVIAEVPFGPLAHTWSLAVEEQFYVAWPLLFAAVAAAISRRRLAVLLVLGAAAATLHRTAAIMDGATGMRYGFGTDMQADSLLVGCALALVIDRIPTHRLMLPAGVLGLIALGLTPVTPASWSLAILASVATIRGGAAGDRVVHRVMTAPPVTALGRISYGVYLWHYPLMWHAGVLEQATPSPSAALLIAVSVGAAAATYRWIESPLRRPAGPHGPRLFKRPRRLSVGRRT